MGVRDNMSGLVWVMECTSVFSYNTAHSRKKKKKRTAKQNTGKQRGRATQQKITVQSTLFHCINISEIKTN